MTCDRSGNITSVNEGTYTTADIEMVCSFKAYSITIDRQCECAEADLVVKGFLKGMGSFNGSTDIDRAVFYAL